MTMITGLSGNEIYCLHYKGYQPGKLVIGNSVYALGILGSIGAGFQNVFGGEVAQITQIIHDGRQQSFARMRTEAAEQGAAGITGVTSELTMFKGNVEFLSVGSCVHGPAPATGAAFSTSGDGQELYCQLDAGYRPLQFVFGNVAYSIGVMGGIFGTLKSLARGEIKEYSDVFNATRHLALERMSLEARAAGANAVVGIKTVIMPFQGVHEMLMLGTAARNDKLPPECSQNPVTSDLTCEELWNITSLGYVPIKLVLGTAVYSLGVIGGIKAALKSIMRGEISDLTSLIYEAREHALGLIAAEAQAIGADQVIGIKTHIHEHGKLVEFMAVGTAIKRMDGIATITPSLPPQAIMQDKTTWLTMSGVLGNERPNGGES